MDQMKQRAMRRWLTEIAEIVQNPSIDPYTAHQQIKAKFDSAKPAPKKANKVLSRSLSGVQQSEIDRILHSAGQTDVHKKICAIKLYRRYTGVGLKDAKDFIEAHINVLARQPRRRSSRAAFRAR